MTTTAPICQPERHVFYEDAPTKIEQPFPWLEQQAETQRCQCGTETRLVRFLPVKR